MKPVARGGSLAGHLPNTLYLHQSAIGVFYSATTRFQERRPVGPTLRAVPNLRVGVGPNMPSQGIKNPVTDLDNYYWKR
jgi:hypothetical protein